MENFEKQLNNQSSVGEIISHAYHNWRGTLLYAFLYTLILLVSSTALSALFLPLSVNNDYYIGLFEVIKNGNTSNIANLPSPKKIDLPMSLGSALVGAVLAPLSAGYLYVIKKHNNNEVFDFSTLFEAYSKDFPKLFLYSLLISIVATIGMSMCLLPGLYVKLISFLAFPTLVFTNHNIMDAIKLAANKTNAEFGVCLGVAVVSVLVIASGLLFFGVGLLLTWPFALSACYSLYLAMNHANDWQQ